MRKPQGGRVSFEFGGERVSPRRYRLAAMEEEWIGKALPLQFFLFPVVIFLMSFLIMLSLLFIFLMNHFLNFILD